MTDLKQFTGVDESFFDLDRENHLARIHLSFDTPDDLFERNVKAKLPLLSGDFMDWILRALDYVPGDFRLDIRVHFDDMAGFSESELAEICKKNLLLETKTRLRKIKRQNRLALLLCAVGLVFILAYILLGALWKSESTARQVLDFVLEIAATVPFWGAADIFFIDGAERRQNAVRFTRKFGGISFGEKE